MLLPSLVMCSSIFWLLTGPEEDPASKELLRFQLLMGLILIAPCVPALILISAQPEKSLRGSCFGCGMSRTEGIHRCWKCGEEFERQDRYLKAREHSSADNFKLRPSTRRTYKAICISFARLLAVCAVVELILISCGLRESHPVLLALPPLLSAPLFLGVLQRGKASLFLLRASADVLTCQSCERKLPPDGDTFEWCPNCRASMVRQRLWLAKFKRPSRSLYSARRTAATKRRRRSRWQGPAMWHYRSFCDLDHVLRANWFAVLPFAVTVVVYIDWLKEVAYPTAAEGLLPGDAVFPFLWALAVSIAAAPIVLFIAGRNFIRRAHKLYEGRCLNCGRECRPNEDTTVTRRCVECGEDLDRQDLEIRKINRAYWLGRT